MDEELNRALSDGENTFAKNSFEQAMHRAIAPAIGKTLVRQIEFEFSNRMCRHNIYPLIRLRSIPGRRRVARQRARYLFNAITSIHHICAAVNRFGTKK